MYEFDVKQINKINGKQCMTAVNFRDVDWLVCDQINRAEMKCNETKLPAGFDKA
jgi:hypothetical protein